MHDWQREIRARLAPLRLRPEREADIVDEISQHLAERYREAISAGASADEATRLALAEFRAGNALAQRIASLRQAHAPAAVTAGVSTGRLLEDLRQDFRYALRAFSKQRTFAATAILTLALGVGATTAIFSVVYSVLIKPLPYPNADELVRIRHGAPGINVADLAAAETMYFTYRDETRSFASIGFWQENSATLIDRGEPQRVRALRLTHGTLQSLGVQPMRGRWFTEGEHGPAGEGPAPVILSHAFWQRRFGGDEAAVGRQLSIDSQSSEVVGIMPPDFRFLDMTPQPDVIVAVRLDPATATNGSFGFQALARLRTGVTPAEARADIERVLPGWLNGWPVLPGSAITPGALEGMRITPIIRPLKDDVVGGVASTLWVLMGAIGGVLLVACANIANLMLVRAAARRQEFAVRTALGAVPARIARALLVESLVLGGAGTVIGLVLAYGAIKILVAIGPANLPRIDEISVSMPVLLFTVVVSIAAAITVGTITAFKYARHVDSPNVGGARGSTGSRERSATRNTLVIAQVALALVLVVSAGLMIRSFQALQDVDPGFSDPATIQTAKIWIPTTLFPDPYEYTRMEREILDGIAALPGVTSVGFASTAPMEGPEANGPPVGVEGQRLDGPITRRAKTISPGYFEAMGTRIIAGRDITWRDIDTGGHVAVISQDFARELAPELEGALGKRIRLPFGQDAWREVVGVVESVHQDGLYAQPPSFVYWPVLMERFGSASVVGNSAVTFVIRSDRAGTAGLVNEVRAAVRSVDASIPVALEGTMQDLYANSLARTSFTLVMLGIAGGMALTLGAIGIYGVIAYVVSQRAREIGIRSALGAQPRDLKRMFILHGLALSGMGAIVGVVSALALGRFMSSVLYGVGPADPFAYAAALGITVAAATLASYIPARRAAKIDPTDTLKAE
jgi:predicted permease